MVGLESALHGQSRVGQLRYGTLVDVFHLTSIIIT